VKTPSTPISRRTLLTGAAALTVAGAASPASAASTAAQTRLWYRKPADRWDAALPIGNGRLGAMVFGRVGQERLQLNEDTLWAGSPYTPDNADARAALPEVRSLINEGKYRQASELASARVMAKPLTQMPYGSLGDLLLTFDGAQAPVAYERELDLATAISTVRCRSAALEYVREAFVSAPDQVIVLRQEAKQGRIGFDVGYRGPRQATYASPNSRAPATDPGREAPVDWLFREAPAASKAEMRIVADGNGWLITGRNETAAGVPAGLTWALRIRIVSDGRITATDDRLTVRDARAVTLLVAAATSFVRFDKVDGDPSGSTRRVLDRAAARSWADLKRRHLRDHQPLFGSFGIDLGHTPAAELPTDQRIAAAESADDPALAALYLQYARYLLLSSSRPGAQPANLQGIWNEGVNPPWGSKYTININTEMNYWPAAPAGLGVCTEPLLRMAEDLSVTGAKTAATMYGARGWVAHHNTDLWRAAAPIDGPTWGLWPCGGAWLCNALWDQYDYSRDRALLERLYPLMKGASQFFLDALVEDPQGRGLVTSPSLSPENAHPFGASLCAGPAMDRQIVRDLFANTVSAGRLLQRDADLLSQFAAARVRLAPDRIGKQGQLQEWLEDWDAAAPEQAHRHVSHLYAVYPGSQLNVRDTPAFIDAAKVTLRQRGDLATGWGTAWRLCLWARMGEGNHAHDILKALLGPRRTYPNMFDAHPPFQIDGNFGGAAGIMEMLLQSWGDEMHLLPALPSAWPAGRVTGLRARGNVSVDLEWRDSRVMSLRLQGPAGAKVRLREKGQAREVVLDRGGRYTFRA
jgi:alpha-L-fucosidase 2